jgi:hypothetical protein
VAIVQISRIQQRKGLQIDLPQLAGGELGWSVDERKLYIGNGTLEEGAPVIGNTEILTEFSNILEFDTVYTYKGERAGYEVQTGPTPSQPISQSLQSRLDDFATITDFGAVGDGITDDTAAINRALFQLYCRQTNPQIRRGLFFPAGVYLVSESILIPPYALLYGEGPTASVIRLDVASDVSTLNAYVARTADSLQQFGVNIGVNAATAPTDITISNLGFESSQETDVFLIDQASNIKIDNTSFEGPLNSAAIIDPLLRGDIACVRFNSTTNFVTTNVTLDTCQFTNTTYGIATGEQIHSARATNCRFDTLYNGVILGGSGLDSTIGGPTGCAILHNNFDNIYEEGIIFDGVVNNMTGYNMFYDVANHFGGISGTAFAPVIDINRENNVSLGDMFTRSDGAAQTYPRIKLNQQQSIAIDNGKTLLLGNLSREAGLTVSLGDNSTNAVLFTIDTSVAKTFSFDYEIVRGAAQRVGKFTVVSDPGLNYNEDYVDNASTGVSFGATQTGSIVTVTYTTTATGTPSLLSYSLTNFN